MLVLDPYKTTYGSLITVSKIREKLVKYLTMNKKLSYEYDNVNNASLDIITGWNEDEKDLPILDHPIVVKDLDGIDRVVVDVRKYITIKDEQPVNILDIAKDKGSVEFIVLRGMLIRDFVSDMIGTHNSIYKSTSSGLAAVVATAINGIVMLDAVEKASVEIATTYYTNCMMVSEDDLEDMIGAITARTSKSGYTLKMTNKTVKDIITNLPRDITGISSLVECIKTVLPTGKKELINVDVLINVLSNSWYGPGNSETVIMAIENIPTLMALLYVNAENKSYKRTQFASIVEKNKRMINTTELVKHLSNYIKENTLT